MSTAGAPPQDLRCEWSVEAPLALWTSTPRLSWRLGAAATQTSYEVEWQIGAGPVERTPVVTSAAAGGVPWPGNPLPSRAVVRWRVRVTDDRSVTSPWSTWAEFESGLLSVSDWGASWIGPDDGDDVSRPALQMRREFEVVAAGPRARLFASAHGVYAVALNGRPVSHELLRPGWTAYRKRLQYQAYDVADLLQPGVNCISVTLLDGWWRGEVTGGRVRNAYGDRLALIAQLEVDGQVAVATDAGWRWSTGGIRSSDMFRGERFDARALTPGWDVVGFDDSGWDPVPVVDQPKDVLTAQRGPSVRIQELRAPVEISRSRSGTTVLDFGENVVGRLRLPFAVPAGHAVELQHAETLKGDEPDVGHLRVPGSGPLQAGGFVGDGSAHVYEPVGASAGFRYVGVRGLDVDEVQDARAVVMRTAARKIGAFGCSDTRLEGLQRIIVRTLEGNLVEVPTDCPTRERAGWTGDLQAFAATAMFNMDLIAFTERWLADVAADQGDDGRVPDIVPWVRPLAVLPPSGTGSVGWGDAATLVPELLYGLTGDPAVLAAQYESMVAWVGFLEARAARRPGVLIRTRPGRPDQGHRRFILDSGFQWADHYPIGHEHPLRILRRFVRVPALIATAFLARSAQATADAAEVLGKDADHDRFLALRKRVANAFVTEFLGDDGRLTPDEQASYVLALAFDLVPESARGRCAERLVELVRAEGDHATTGFLATPHLLPVLAQSGHPDVAYDILLNESAPSWLAMLAAGATTVWESLDAVRPDGRAKFRSLNHYTFGCVGDFMYRYVAGLDVSRIGLGELTVRPTPGGGLTSARASFDSVHGRASISWESRGDELAVELTVPPNTVATVAVTGARLQPGDHALVVPVSPPWAAATIQSNS